MLKILEPGLLTTVQDLGRFGWYHIGMPPAGAMDNFSFRVGNLLVGNDENAAGLEITFIGPTLTVTTDAIVAVTGAELPFRINNRPAVLWQAYGVTSGDTLALGGVERGARSYLCVAGGVDVPVLLGSRSTYMLGRFGGLGGRKLHAGDELPLGPCTLAHEAMLNRSIDRPFLPSPTKDLEVRVIIGMYN